MYSIVFNFEGKRQSAGKMKKKFSFITKPLSTAFFLCLTSLSFFVEGTTPEKELVVCFGYRLFLDIILSLYF